MKKLFVIIVTAVFLSMFSASADSYAFKRGYRGNVGLGVIGPAGKNMFDGFVTLETNHGFSFGNGLYVGGGVSANAHADANYGFVPIYGEVKYNFLNCLVSPFVDARVGVNFLADTDAKKTITGFLVSPMIGVDIWRFTLGFHYQYSAFTSETKMGLWGLNLYFNW